MRRCSMHGILCITCTMLVIDTHDPAWQHEELEVQNDPSSTPGVQTVILHTEHTVLRSNCSSGPKEAKASPLLPACARLRWRGRWQPVAVRRIPLPGAHPLCGAYA